MASGAERGRAVSQKPGARQRRLRMRLRGPRPPRGQSRDATRRRPWQPEISGRQGRGRLRRRSNWSAGLGTGCHWRGRARKSALATGRQRPGGGPAPCAYWRRRCRFSGRARSAALAGRGKVPSAGTWYFVPAPVLGTLYQRRYLVLVPSTQRQSTKRCWRYFVPNAKRQSTKRRWWPPHRCARKAGSRRQEKCLAVRDMG